MENNNIKEIEATITDILGYFKQKCFEEQSKMDSDITLDREWKSLDFTLKHQYAIVKELKSVLDNIYSLKMVDDVVNNIKTPYLIRIMKKDVFGHYSYMEFNGEEERNQFLQKASKLPDYNDYIIEVV